MSRANARPGSLKSGLKISVILRGSRCGQRGIMDLSVFPSRFGHLGTEAAAAAEATFDLSAKQSFRFAQETGDRKVRDAMAFFFPLEAKAIGAELSSEQRSR